MAATFSVTVGMQFDNTLHSLLLNSQIHIGL
jgi:hypothetical protein